MVLQVSIGLCVGLKGLMRIDRVSTGDQGLFDLCDFAHILREFTA